MAAHIEMGKKGEEIALQYLKGKGYTILDQNWRNNRYEIDIVAKEGSIVVIVEVKTRSANTMVDALLAIDTTKRRHLMRAANAYLFSKQLKDEVRFDIITIGMGGKNPEILHVPNAFYPTLRG
jgi:putative endonuclease